MHQLNASDAPDNTRMLQSKGIKFGAFVILFSVLIAYTVLVDAKGGRGGRAGRSRGGGGVYYSHRSSRRSWRYYVPHSTHSRHGESSSTKSCPSLMLIGALFISTASLHSDARMLERVPAAGS